MNSRLEQYEQQYQDMESSPDSIRIIGNVISGYKDSIFYCQNKKEDILTKEYASVLRNVGKVADNIKAN